MKYSSSRIAFWLAAVLLSVGTPASASDGSEFVRGFLNDTDYAPIHSAMREYFPDSAQNLVRALEETASEIGIDSSDRVSRFQMNRLNEAIGLVINEFYERHGPAIYHAPEQDLRAVIQTHVQPLKYLQRHGNDCNAYLLYGGGSQMVETEVPYQMIEDAALAKFAAMNKGEDASPKRNPMTEYPDSLRQQLFAGLDQEEVRMISSPEIDNPKTCSANIKFFENIWRAEGAGAELNRARSALILVGQG